MLTPPLVRSQAPLAMAAQLSSSLDRPLTGGADAQVRADQQGVLSDFEGSQFVLASQNPLYNQSASPSDNVLYQHLGSGRVPGLKPQSSAFDNERACPSFGLQKSSSITKGSAEQRSTFVSARQMFSRRTGGTMFESPETCGHESDDLCQYASPWQEAGAQKYNGSNVSTNTPIQDTFRLQEGTLELTFWERLELARSGLIEREAENGPDSKAGPEMLPTAFGSVEASFRTPSEEDLPLAEPFSPNTAEQAPEIAAHGVHQQRMAGAGVDELHRFSEVLRREAAAMDELRDKETTVLMTRASGIGRYRLSEGSPHVGHVDLRPLADSGQRSWVTARWSEKGAGAVRRRSGENGGDVLGVTAEDGMRMIVDRILGRVDHFTEDAILPHGNSVAQRRGSYALQEAYREEGVADAWAWEEVSYVSRKSSPSRQAKAKVPTLAELRRRRQWASKSVARGSDSYLSSAIDHLYKQLDSVASSLWSPIKRASEQAHVPAASVATGAVLSFILTILLYRRFIGQMQP
jgi:hypothetical protein